jgi:pyruvate formate lyase activating enzyme
MPRGRIFDIQRFSIHDGPGIRTTVFLKGCPLLCSWCHNPEGRSHEMEPWVIEGRCVRCGACLGVCPDPAFGPGEVPIVDAARCLRCGACVEACVTGARRLVGRDVGVEDVISEVERDRPFYEESGGGVTLSGGEPFAQADFLLACLRASRDAGFHTAVDTSGHAPREVLLEATRWTDLFLYDLKLFDDERHRRETGVPAGPILDNLRALDEAGASVWVRIPLLPGVNDDTGNLDGLARFVKSLGTVRRVHLLPFHRSGTHKTHRPSGLAPPTRKALEVARERLARHALDVRVGG